LKKNKEAQAGLYGECGARAYDGIWGQSPHQGPGAEPLHGQGEAESFLAFA